MLVLSRREAERVLFPQLGISVEVVKVQGKTVRVGIDAPLEIRVIRGELSDEEFGNPNSGADPCVKNGDAVESPISRPEIQKNLDAANLAIHLAQNQLRQKLHDRAEEALGHAIECLEQLENAISGKSESQPDELTVHEARSGYRLRSKPIAVIVQADDHQLEERLSDRLHQKGYSTLTLEDTPALVHHFQSNDQPAAVFTIETASNDQANPVSDSPNSELRVHGIKGLQNCHRFSVGQKWIHGWFTDPDKAETLVGCLQESSWDNY